MKYPWTAEWDAALRAGYAHCLVGRPTVAIDKLQRLTGYPRYIVRLRAQRLGITRDTRRPWTPVELRMLRENAGHVSVKGIAAMLGRSHESVASRMQIESLKRSVRCGYSMQQLADMLGVDAHSVRKWIASGRLTLNAERRISGTAVQQMLWVHLEALDLRLCNQVWLKDQLRSLMSMPCGLPGVRFKGAA